MPIASREPKSYRRWCGENTDHRLMTTPLEVTIFDATCCSLILNKHLHLHLFTRFYGRVYRVNNLQIFYSFITINRYRWLFAVKYDIRKLIHLYGLVGGNRLIQFALVSTAFYRAVPCGWLHFGPAFFAIQVKLIKVILIVG
jgi:hypothetical protein